LSEARDDGVPVATAGPYTNHLHLIADRTTPAPNPSIVYRLDAIPATQPTVSKH